MQTVLQLQQNRLLSALPADIQACIRPHIELFLLPMDYMIHEPLGNLKYAYFPVDCIISKVSTLASGDSIEIAAIGNEGMVSVFLFMGGESMHYETIVRNPGWAYRVNREILKEVFRRSTATQLVFLRYAQALITQMAQSAVCNRHHQIEQRVCNFLLMSQDRLFTDNMNITQERISYLLGVRRESVTEAARKLQEMEVILYGRGRIKILNRRELEKLACECYGVVTSEFARLMPASTIDHSFLKIS